VYGLNNTTVINISLKINFSSKERQVVVFLYLYIYSTIHYKNYSGDSDTYLTDFEDK